MLNRLCLIAVFCLAVVAGGQSASAQARAICYNCPPEWADWGSQLKAIQSTLGIPIKLVGLGETVDDLVTFDPDEFIDALFAEA